MSADKERHDLAWSNVIREQGSKIRDTLMSGGASEEEVDEFLDEQWVAAVRRNKDYIIKHHGPDCEILKYLKDDE